MRRPKAMVLTTLAALALGCGGGSQPGSADAPEQRTVLRIENDNFSDMRIYVWRNSQRIRVGVANAKSVTTIPLNRTIVIGIQTLRIEADPIGGRGSAVSEQITVTPGEEIVLRIPP